MQVADAGAPDDHKAPSLLMRPGSPGVISFNKHDEDKVLRTKVSSTSGDIETFATATEQTVTCPWFVSYSQTFWISGDSSQDTYIEFFRTQLSFQYGWGLRRYSVNKATRAQTEVQAPTQFLSTGARQSYMNPTQVGTTLQVAFSYNPAAADHAIYAMKFDLLTGAVTTNPAGTANLYTGAGLPILDTALTPAVATTASGSSRRLGAVSRHGHILYAEGSTSDPDNWRYKVARLIAGAGALVPGTTGHATAAYKAAMDMPTGFDIRVGVKGFTGAPTADVELARRFQGAAEGDGTRAWSFRITPTRKLQVNYVTSTAASNNQPTTASVPGLWTEDMHVRVVFKSDNGAGKATFTFMYSTDQGATWTQLQYIELSPFTLQATTLPMHTATNQTASLRGVTGVHYANLYNLAGTLLTGADFRTAWTPGATSYTDPTGNAWTISGDAAVSKTADTYTVDDVFGVMGQRVGYTSASNYGGMGTWADSEDVVLYLATNVAEVGKLDKWRYVNGWGSPLNLVTDTEHWIGRPYAPVGGGPFEVTYVKMLSYGADYTEYSGELVAL